MGTISISGRSPTTSHGPDRRRFRILHLVSTFALKTDTKWLLQIAEHLDRDRFELTAACFFEGGEVRDLLADKGVTTHNLNVFEAYDPRAVIRAHRLIEQCRPDLVHTHLLRADLWGGLAARWANVPVSISTAYAMGSFRRAIRRRLDPLLDSATVLLPTQVLAVCEAVRLDCIERLGLPPQRVKVIRTGIEPPVEIDAADVARMRREFGPGPLIVTTARLAYEKGIDTLIDAAAVIARRRPDARFLVVGEGPMRCELQRRIAALNLARTVSLIGFRQDVWPCLAAADVFCLPSHSEGMPNALLEAMAVGRPIVATAVGGVPEALADGRNGLLVPPADARALATGLERMLDDPRLAGQLGRAARVEVESRFLARDVVRQYGRWYESLIQLAEAPGAA